MNGRTVEGRLPGFEKWSKVLAGLFSTGQKGGRWILWAGVLGAGLLLTLGFAEGGGKEETPAAAQTSFSVQSYESTLEERLTALLTQVQGAGKVSVMVTLESTEQAVYAQVRQESSDTAQTQQESLTRRSSYTEEYILMETDGEERPLTETVLQPAVKGVAVVCEGAEDAGVVNCITELVSTVLGIPSNRIFVTK